MSSSSSSVDNNDFSNFTTGSILGGMTRGQIRPTNMTSPQELRSILGAPLRRQTSGASSRVANDASLGGAHAADQQQRFTDPEKKPLRSSVRQILAANSERGTSDDSSDDSDGDLDDISRDLLGAGARRSETQRRGEQAPARKRRRTSEYDSSSGDEDRELSRRSRKRQRRVESFSSDEEGDDDGVFSKSRRVSPSARRRSQQQRPAGRMPGNRRFFTRDAEVSSDSEDLDDEALDRRDQVTERRLSRQRAEPDVNSSRRLFGIQPRHTARRRRADMDSSVLEARHDPVMREIRRLQHTTHRLIPKLPFARLVKELSDDCCEDMDLESTFKWTGDALDALHESAEAHLVKVMERSNWCAQHAKRITLTNKDVQLSRRLSEKDVCPTWMQATASEGVDY